MKTIARDVCGIILEELEGGGKIISAKEGLCGRKISVGDFVQSNGRRVPDFPETGRRGIVIKIHEPFNGRTNDILEVHFEGEVCSDTMKFKDLQ